MKKKIKDGWSGSGITINKENFTLTDLVKEIKNRVEDKHKRLRKAQIVSKTQWGVEVLVLVTRGINHDDVITFTIDAGNILTDKKTKSKIMQKLWSYVGKTIYENKTLGKDSLKTFKVNNIVVKAKDYLDAIKKVKDMSMEIYGEKYEIRRHADKVEAYKNGQLVAEADTMRELEHKLARLGDSINDYDSDITRIANKFNKDYHYGILVEDLIEKYTEIKHFNDVRDALQVLKEKAPGAIKDLLNRLNDSINDSKYSRDELIRQAKEGIIYIKNEKWGLAKVLFGGLSAKLEANQNTSDSINDDDYRVKDAQSILVKEKKVTEDSIKDANKYDIALSVAKNAYSKTEILNAYSFIKNCWSRGEISNKEYYKLIKIVEDAEKDL